MLTLINTNRMTPAIAPIGLEYVAEAAQQQGIDVDVLDLALSDAPETSLTDYLSQDTRAERRACRPGRGRVLDLRRPHRGRHRRRLRHPR